jgi:hypothetical protein
MPLVRSLRVAVSLFVVGAVLATAFIVYAPSAAARFCGYDGYIKTVDDYAYTQQRSGSECSQIGARHYYDPVWSGVNYWTNWKYSSGSYVASTPTAEIVRGEHVGRL